MGLACDGNVLQGKEMLPKNDIFIKTSAPRCLTLPSNQTPWASLTTTGNNTFHAGYRHDLQYSRPVLPEYMLSQLFCNEKANESPRRELIKTKSIKRKVVTVLHALLIDKRYVGFVMSKHYKELWKVHTATFDWTDKKAEALGWHCCEYVLNGNTTTIIRMQDREESRIKLNEK